jgi:hypothetical protein
MVYRVSEVLLLLETSVDEYHYIVPANAAIVLLDQVDKLPFVLFQGGLKRLINHSPDE